ncbi:MAG: tetratricopeptide repeat protein, partial [Muribaculaceae bacterium]|nr:tetratricopeptide repeat protein [Muribaculaceae bacterium]
MKLKRLMPALVCACALSTFPLQAQEGLNDPMTRAMMEVYDAELRANPEAYDIYFRRANEYYKFDQYLRALSDIDNAIKYAPADDAEMLFQCYSLRADTYEMLGKWEEALADYTKALDYDPTSFMALYQKANCEYELGRYADAKVSYN